MDSQLIKRVQQDNDHQAFERLVKQYQSPVRQFLRRLSNQDLSIADELSQETFLKAFIHIKTYRGEGKFLSWLFQIAYQQFINCTRKKTEITNYQQHDVADNGDFEEQIIKQDTFNRLLAHLKTDERAALLLHYSFDLSHREISAILPRPLGSVKSLIRRSKLKLQALVQQQGEHDETGY